MSEGCRVWGWYGTAHGEWGAGYGEGMEQHTGNGVQAMGRVWHISLCHWFDVRTATYEKAPAGQTEESAGKFNGPVPAP